MTSSYLGSQSETRRQLQFEEVNDGDGSCDIPCEVDHKLDDTMDLGSSEDLNRRLSLIPKELKPRVNMEFETEEKAWQFYLEYARAGGFSARKSKRHLDKNGKLVDRIFCCSAEGERGKDKRYIQARFPRRQTRCGCLAKMKINSRLTGKFRVVNFVEEHNHHLSSPNKTHMHRSHRKITSTQAADIEMANSVGIAPKAAHDLMARQVGGHENVGFTRDDYKNYLGSKRSRKIEPGDTGGVLEYLQKMQFKDPNFFYAIQVDTDDMITNIFWSDGKMKADYANFGDVICFDTTYRKNREGRPIALFVGVNHHKQSILFGAALLYDETAQTFEWLFDTFLKAMSREKPKTILTDQDPAMAKALASKWPETCHRLCIWHIYQNAASHLSSVFSEYKSFRKAFKSCIYDFEEEEDFINAWNEMLDKYDLQQNQWLKRMFGIKEKWALVYGRQTFCADITTTQRSESMNSLLKRYVSYKHSFLDFFDRFERLLEDRRYAELRADFIAKASFPFLEYPCKILEHAASVYTPEAFECFKSEWKKCIDAAYFDCNEPGSVKKYEITPSERQYHHTVLFDTLNDKWECSCRKFEFCGILCSHVLKVFNIRNIVKIPDQYILKRWTHAAKTGYEDSTIDTSNAGPKVVTGLRYRELCRLHIHLAAKASEDEKTYKIAKDGLLKMIQEVDTVLQSVESPPVNSGADVNCSKDKDMPVGEENNIKAKGVKVKKKPSSGKRLRSNIEKSTKGKKKANKVCCSSSRRKSSTYAEAIENSLDPTFSTTTGQFPSLCYAQQGQSSQSYQTSVEKTTQHMVGAVNVGKQLHCYNQSSMIGPNLQKNAQTSHFMKDAQTSFGIMKALEGQNSEGYQTSREKLKQHIIEESSIGVVNASEQLRLYNQSSMVDPILQTYVQTSHFLNDAQTSFGVTKALEEHNSQGYPTSMGKMKQHLTMINETRIGVNEEVLGFTDPSVGGRSTRSMDGVSCNEHCGCTLPCQGGILCWCKGYRNLSI